MAIGKAILEEGLYGESAALHEPRAIFLLRLHKKVRPTLVNRIVHSHPARHFQRDERLTCGIRIALK